MKQIRLKTKRIKNKYFIKFLKDTIIADLKRLELWFPFTISFLTGKMKFILVDYDSIREMNMNLVGKQCTDLIARYNRIYNKNADFMLCTPPK